jgi:hypothetical protein
MTPTNLFLSLSLSSPGLNVNRGQQILVRLRYPHNSSSFLPFEHALDTMLHEYASPPPPKFNTNY